MELSKKGIFKVNLKKNDMTNRKSKETHHVLIEKDYTETKEVKENVA